MEEKKTTDTLAPETEDRASSAATDIATDVVATDAAVATDTAVAADTAAEGETGAGDGDITARLRIAGDRIDRASTEAEVFKRRRDKESAEAGLVTATTAEGERKRIEDDLKKREAVVEERRAAMEYAENYRARLRAERESNAALRKKSEEKERIKAEEKSAREREIAEGIEREREEARARSARTESLLSRVDGSVSTIAIPATTDADGDERTAPVSSLSPDAVPEKVPSVTATEDGGAIASDDKRPTGEAPHAPTEEATDTVTVATSEKEDYVIRIEDDEPKKDILYIDGATACEISLGTTAPVTPAPAAETTAATVSAAPATTAAASVAAATATAAVAPVSVATAAVASDTVIDDASAVSDFDTKGKAAKGKRVKDKSKKSKDKTKDKAKSSSTYTEKSDGRDYKAIKRVETTDTKREPSEYSSSVSSVSLDDIPTAPVSLAAESAVEDYEASHELLHHASEVPKKQFKAKSRGEDFDITPKYPDPVGKPISKKELKRREKEALEEERRALLEFNRVSKKKTVVKAKKSAEERAIEDYENAEESRRMAMDSAKLSEKRAAPAPAPTVEKTAPVSIHDTAYPDPKPVITPSAPPSSAVSTKAVPAFDKKALQRNKKRQVKNDLLLIEHRIYDDIRRLEMDTRTGEISFSAKIDDGKKKRERLKTKEKLTDAREKLKLAKKYETKDNERYYRTVMLDIDKARLPRRTDKEELRELRDRLIALLKTRDDLNLKLIELYSISEGGKAGMAQGRFNAELEGKRRAYRRQLVSYKKYEKANISLGDKEVLYALMDERTELFGELAKIEYMLKKEKAKGEARRQLRKNKRSVERRLEENKRAILHNERKALRMAARVREGNRAAIIGWTVLAVIVAAVVLVIVFWDTIQPWLTDTAMPWLQEMLGKLMEWIKSISGEASLPTDTHTLL